MTNLNNNLEYSRLLKFSQSLYKHKTLLPYLTPESINLAYRITNMILENIFHTENLITEEQIFNTDIKSLKQNYKLLNVIDIFKQNIKSLTLDNKVHKSINEMNINNDKIYMTKKDNISNHIGLTIYEYLKSLDNIKNLMIIDNEDILLIGLNIKPKSLIIYELKNNEHLNNDIINNELNIFDIIKDRLLPNLYESYIYYINLPSNEKISIIEQELENLNQKLSTLYGKTIDIRLNNSGGINEDKFTLYDSLVWSALISSQILYESGILYTALSSLKILLPAFISGWLIYKLTNWLADTIDEYDELKHFIERVFNTDYQTFLTKLFLNCVITNVQINYDEYKRLKTNDERKQFLESISNNCSKEIKQQLDILNTFITDRCSNHDILSPYCIDEFKLNFKDIHDLLTKTSIKELSEKCVQVCGDSSKKIISRR